jgi:uncharacterized delta-60 repeat protein
MLALALVACGHHNAGTTDANNGGDGGNGTADGNGDGSGSGGGDAGMPAGGMLDPGFGSGGIVTVSSTGADHAYDLAVQPDGKIVVVGDAHEGMLVLRFLDNGALDPAFGTGGRVTIGTTFNFGHGVALQPDGTIVVAGYVDGGTVVRLTATGALDPTFGNAGIATTTPREANDVTVRGDGTLVVCGLTSQGAGTQQYGYVTRLSATGAVDTTFGTNGYSMLTAEAGGGFYRLAIDAQDRIVALGTVYYDYPSGNGDNFMLGRFLADGTPDPGFPNGYQLAGGQQSLAHDLALQPDGQPIEIGETSDFDGDGHLYMLAHRTDTSGVADQSFGPDGDHKWIPYELLNASAQGVTLQPDGAIVVVGEGTVEGSNSDQMWASVARLTSAAMSDGSFGTNGAMRFTVGSLDLHPRATALASSGAIYVTGFESMPTSGTSSVFLARVH